MIMKKTIKSLLALAAVAFTFAACSDVPEPYPAPGSTPKEEIGDGTEEDPLTVSKAIKKGSSTGAFVKGYIVGYIWGTKADVGAVFGASDTATVASNILFAESADETSVSKCMPVQLPVGAVRTALNLKDNKGMYKKEVTLYGTIEKYFGNTGMKQVSYAIADGQTYGTKPGEPEPEGEVQTVTIAEFNAASVSTANWYQLTGTIKNLKDDDQYGNFDIEDATGSVYVYGLLSEKGGAKQKFQELVAAQGLQAGTKITIIGNRSSYNGQIQVANAYFVKVEDSSDTPGGGESGASSITVAMSSLGVANGVEVGTKTLTDGTVLTFDKGSNNNAPKYYDSGTAVRMYPNNSVTVTASKKIASIKLTCSANNAEGKISASKGTIVIEGMTVNLNDIDDTTTTITNSHTGTGAASQLRIASIEITYAK